MKGTELRVGNLYQWLHEEHETIEVVDIDFLKRQETYDIDPEDEVFCRGWWARPIEINEEWLYKFGFKKSGLSWEKDQVFIHESFDQFDVDFEYRFNYTKVYVKEVHQLQNLYYALTGKELTLKPH